HAIDIEQLGDRLRVYRRGESLEGASKLSIRRRRQDLPSGTPDGGEAKFRIIAVLLVERCNRMRAKRRRDRRILAELRSDGGILGDESVDQLQRGDLLAA